MTFAERNSYIDRDPLVELMRRRQSWAAAPGAGQSQIVPLETIDAAIAELLKYRIADNVPGATALAEVFYDL